MNKNLVDYVGRPYFAERFSGCMFFMPDKNPAYIDNQRNWPSGKIAVNKVTGGTTKVEVVQEMLPHDFFTDMGVFATPPLGWRMAAQGRYMLHLRRRNVGSQNRYQRGLSARILDKEISPATNYLIDTGNISEDFYNRESTVVSMVMQPEYYPLKEGLELMRSGELFSFCVNPNLAVIPDVGETHAILYNRKKVARINAKNQVKTDVPGVSTMISEHL